jgi:Rieske 2Fe-2S family protein
VLIVRGKDRQVRAFLNACVHRGNKLQLGSGGQQSVFTCKFHGWTYGLDGAVARIPDGDDGFPGVDCGGLSLRRLHMDVWEGFIFVNVEDEPRQMLDQYLGRQASDLAGYPFEEGVTRFKFAGVVNTNWKFLIDSFCESYHIHFLHKKSIDGPMAGPENPFGRAVDVRIKGIHRTFSTRGNRDWSPKPLQALASKHSPGLSITAAGDDPKSMPKGVNESGSPDWAMDVNVFFPNLICTIGAGTYYIHQVWPLAPNKTKYELTGYMQPATNAAQRFGQQHAISEIRDVILEDLNVLERVQKNMETGLIDHIYFHDHEIALRYQHYTVQNKLNGSTNEVAESTS